MSLDTAILLTSTVFTFGIVFFVFMVAMALRKGDPYDSTRAIFGIICSVEVSLQVALAH